MEYVCQVSDLEEKKPYVTEIKGHEIGFIHWKNEIYAYANYCPHAGGPVCLGDIRGKVKANLDDEKKKRGEYEDENELMLICPWHGYSYELDTGNHVSEDNLKLGKYTTKVDNDQLFVDLDG